jgi:hypothetical protein
MVPKSVRPLFEPEGGNTLFRRPEICQAVGASQPRQCVPVIDAHATMIIAGDSGKLPIAAHAVGIPVIRCRRVLFVLRVYHFAKTLTRLDLFGIALLQGDR